jgi:imidazolonepropionase
VATLLPGTSFFIGKPYAPARKIIDEGIVVALATDFNPGSSVTQNLLLIATIAATQMKMTIPEVLSAITYNAAKSLGLQDKIGSIEVGKQADLAFFEAPSYEYLPYHFGDNFCKRVIFSGQAENL